LRAVQVVVISVGISQFAGMVEVKELVSVEALSAELAVEALKAAVLGGLGWGRDD
jgi:hypothetical protein